jgi:hypothetical protein
MEAALRHGQIVSVLIELKRSKRRQRNGGEPKLIVRTWRPADFALPPFFNRQSNPHNASRTLASIWFA